MWRNSYSWITSTITPEQWTCKNSSALGRAHRCHVRKWHQQPVALFSWHHRDTFSFVCSANNPSSLFANGCLSSLHNDLFGQEDARDSSQALGFIYVCPWKANTWKLNFAFLHFYLFKMKCPYQKQYNQPNDWRIRSYVSLAPWPWIDHIVQTCLVKFDERFMEGFFRTPLGRNFHCAKVPQSA